MSLRKVPKACKIVARFFLLGILLDCYMLFALTMILPRLNIICIFPAGMKHVPLFKLNQIQFVYLRVLPIFLNSFFISSIFVFQQIPTRIVIVRLS